MTGRYDAAGRGTCTSKISTIRSTPVAEQVRAWVPGPGEEPEVDSAEPTGLAAYAGCLETLVALDREMDT